MRGHSVDIITTNIILAMRDVEEKREFFDLLGIKIDHNFADKSGRGN